MSAVLADGASNSLRAHEADQSRLAELSDMANAMRPQLVADWLQSASPADMGDVFYELGGDPEACSCLQRIIAGGSDGVILEAARRIAKLALDRADFTVGDRLVDRQIESLEGDTHAL